MSFRLAFLLCAWLAATPSWAVTTIFSDTFTDTNGVDLDAHTPDTGTSWTEINLTGANQLGILSNTLQSETTNSAQGSMWSADGTYSTANYTVTITCTDCGAGISSVAWWIGCRLNNTGGWDGYIAAIADATNTNDARIYRLDNGAATKISSTEDTGPADSDVFQLECDGSAIGLKKNGSYVIGPINDATYSAAGKGGTGSGEVFGLTEWGTIAGNFDIDNFVVETIDNSATFGPLRRRLL